MSQYTVTITRNAQKQLDKVPKNMKGRLQADIDSLARDPRPYGVEKMQGFDNQYRIRNGDWRIIYQIYDKSLEVIVIKVGDRKDVYD